MKLKTIITIALLLFILASVAYLVMNEVRSDSKSVAAETDLSAVVDNQEPSSEVAVSGKSSPQLPQKVVVYYFHGTARCPTCRKFESFSNEAFQEAFAEELKNGRLEWCVVNVDKPGNKHYVSDYQLYSKSIVIVKIQNGKQIAWKNLNRIWELVRKKETFVKYVQDEVRTYLEAD